MRHFNEIITSQARRLLESKAAGPGSMRIAIIEDDLADFFLLGKILDEMPTSIHSFSLFSAAHDLIEADDKDFDVIMLDHQVGNSQISPPCIGQIRQANKRSGIIVYAGRVTPEVRMNALRDGAFAVVQKGTLRPFELEALLKAAALVGWRIAPASR